MKIKYLKQKNEDEVKQLKDIIIQLEGHISQVQEGKGESDRKLIIAKEQYEQMKRDLARAKVDL